MSWPKPGKGGRALPGSLAAVRVLGGPAGSFWRYPVLELPEVEGVGSRGLAPSLGVAGSGAVDGPGDASGGGEGDLEPSVDSFLSGGALGSAGSSLESGESSSRGEGLESSLE